MKRSILYFQAALVLLLAAAGCTRQQKPPAAEEGLSMLDAKGIFGVPVSAPKPVDPNTVIATVDQREITQGQFDREALMLMAGLRNQKIPPEKLGQVRSRITGKALEKLVTQALLFNQLEKEDIPIEPARLDEQIDRLKKAIPTNTTFTAYLEKNKITEQDLRREFTTQLKIVELMNRVGEIKTPPTEAEIKEFYETNPKQFDAPADVKVRHILIGKTKDDQEADLVAKKKQAEELRVKLEAGADFAKTATESSTCPISKDRGGDLGYIRKGRSLPEFENLVFNLPTNQVSQVLETKLGFHVVEVLEKRPERHLSLEETSVRIGEVLTAQRKQKQLGDYLKKLRDAADIQFKGQAPKKPDPGDPISPEKTGADDKLIKTPDEGSGLLKDLEPKP